MGTWGFFSLACNRRLKKKKVILVAVFHSNIALPENVVLHCVFSHSLSRSLSHTSCFHFLHCNIVTAPCKKLKTFNQIITVTYYTTSMQFHCLLQVYPRLTSILCWQIQRKISPGVTHIIYMQHILWTKLKS